MGIKIVRRMDELGKIVLPKEIRKELSICAGDRVELSIDNKGQVILNKYSALRDLGYFAREYTDTLYETLGHIAMISDKDVIVAVSGINKRKFLYKPIGKIIARAIAEKDTIIINDMNARGEEVFITEADVQEYIFNSLVIVPIISQGNPIGAIIVVAKNDGIIMGEIEVKLIKVAASFLAKHIEL